MNFPHTFLFWILKLDLHDIASPWNSNAGLKSKRISSRYFPVFRQNLSFGGLAHTIKRLGDCDWSKDKEESTLGSEALKLGYLNGLRKISSYSIESLEEIEQLKCHSAFTKELI